MGIGCGTVDQVIHVNLSRLRRSLLLAAIAAAVAGPVTGAARPEAVPAPVPAAFPTAFPAAGSAVPAAVAPLRTATPASAATAASTAALEARFAAVRDDILAAERTAAGHGDLRRAAMLRAMADPARRFLSFDGRDGGRTAEVFGDLASAGRIAVLVPGSDTSLDKYGLLRGGSLRLRQALGDRAAVIAWLGYRPPAMLSLAALTTGRADDAAPALRAFVRGLTALKPAARISLVCHSYGGVACGKAAQRPDTTSGTTTGTTGTAAGGTTGTGIAGVSDIVLIGSPGSTAADVRALRTRSTLWAGRGGHDWIACVPHARLHLPFVTLGFGQDPAGPGSGARLFATGDGGHSDYLDTGSLSLRNIARIVSGQHPVQAGGRV
ncbi:alpha/beta hydrolase family protein [Nonomuraea rosea]|uniref:Alpha/beta hydrolase family protein n=1 Tax=Nonomuraea rosea TaxID=638574 RepID=A0ABP6Z6Q7_9ACTN